MSGRRSLLGAALAALVLVAGAPVAHAQPKDAPPADAQKAQKPVAVRVDVVLASNQGDVVDPPELEKMKASFQKQAFAFTSFRRLQSETLQLAPGKPGEVRLPNGGRASLTLVKLEGNTATVRVDQEGALAVDVRLGREGHVYQHAGDHGGGKLVLALSRPKDGK